MTSANLKRACTVLALFTAGCGRSTENVSPSTSAGSPVAQNAAADDRSALGKNDAWRGLVRHEIQLERKLLVVRGSKGVIGCPYLNIGSFEKFGEPCAIVPAADTAGMLDSKVTAITTKAKELGIEVGMSGREAMDRIR